jgi:hypothetical protein
LIPCVVDQSMDSDVAAVVADDGPKKRVRLGRAVDATQPESLSRFVAALSPVLRRGAAVGARLSAMLGRSPAVAHGPRGPLRLIVGERIADRATRSRIEALAVRASAVSDESSRILTETAPACARASRCWGADGVGRTARRGDRRPLGRFWRSARPMSRSH